jgi:hypothetical protein
VIAPRASQDRSGDAYERPSSDRAAPPAAPARESRAAQTNRQRAKRSRSESMPSK